MFMYSICIYNMNTFIYRHWYIYTYVYVYTCIYTYIYIYIYIYVYVYVYICIYISIYIYVYIFVCIYIYVCVFSCMICTHIYIYLYTCIHVLVNIYVYIFMVICVHTCKHLNVYLLLNTVPSRHSYVYIKALVNKKIFVQSLINQTCNWLVFVYVSNVCIRTFVFVYVLLSGSV